MIKQIKNKKVAAIISAVVVILVLALITGMVAMLTNGFGGWRDDPVIPAPVDPNNPTEPEEPKYTPTGDFSYTIDEGSATITGYYGADLDVVIPLTVDDYPITSIGAEAFKNCSRITSVIVPKGVIRIGAAAFSGCSGLTSITLPFVGSSETSGTSDAVLGYIFGTTKYTGGTLITQNYAASSYVTYYIPEALKTVTITRATVIPYGAFSDCRNITNITVSDSVTSIDAYAYSSCYSIANIVIPGSVTSIGTFAFQNCYSITNITVPDSVTTIGFSAFSGCGGLTSMILPFVGASITTNGTFGSMFGTMSYAGGIAAVQSATTYYVPAALKTVKITVATVISNNAFAGCSNLTSVVISDSVTNIGYSAFSGCGGLTEMTLPFVGNTRTATVTYGLLGYMFGETSYTGGVSTTQRYNSTGSSLTYYIPASLKTVVLTSATQLAYGAFNNCTNLTSITVNDGVTSIASFAFNGCSRLTSIVVPDGVTSLPSFVLSNCTNLTSVVVPNSVTSISSGLLNGCNNLTDVVLPFVGSSRTATNNEALLGFMFGSGIATVQYYSATASVTSYIPASLKTVTITGATKIPYGAFYNCTNITSITINDGVKSIGDYAFYNCGKLTDIIIPAGVTSAGASAFYNCSNIASVTIPVSTTSIGSNAFYYCSGLKSVYYSGNIADWQAITFGDEFANPLYYAGNFYLNN